MFNATALNPRIIVTSASDVSLPISEKSRDIASSEVPGKLVKYLCT